MPGGLSSTKLCNQHARLLTHPKNLSAKLVWMVTLARRPTGLARCSDRPAAPAPALALLRAMPPDECCSEGRGPGQPGAGGSAAPPTLEPLLALMPSGRRTRGARAATGGQWWAARRRRRRRWH